MVSSAVGEKVRKRVIPPSGRINPLELKSASLLLTVSHMTEQNLVYIFLNLVERETLCQLLDGGGFCVGVYVPPFVPILESASYKDQ